MTAENLKISEVSEKDYRNLIGNGLHVYNSPGFINLNKDRCSGLVYLLFYDDRHYYAGIILGLRNGEFLSPFSAPFGGFDFKKELHLETVEKIISVFTSYCKENGSLAEIVIPPVFINPQMEGKFIGALIQNSLWKDNVCFNYHYDLSNFPDFESFLSRNSKKNFHNSLKIPFEFYRLPEGDDSIKRAYSIIKTNRESLGYPLKMTEQMMIETSKVVNCDFFVLTLEGKDVAAAQVYHVAPEITQVINWGDLPEFRHLRPMNFFSYKIFEYYYNKGVKICDLGPANNSSGTPNYSLADYKEGLGCKLSLRHLFTLNPAEKLSL